MLKHIQQPISFRSRDHRVAALVRATATTDDALFEAQFGEWPVRGLDKDTVRDAEVQFKHFYANLLTLAYVDPTTPDRTIHLNGTLLSPAGHALGIFSTRQAWARLHDVIEILEPSLLGPRLGLFVFMASFLSSYRYAALSSLTKLVAPSIADEVGQEHLHIMQTKDGDQSFARSAYQAAARDMVRNSSLLKRAGTNVAQFMDMMLTWMPRDYYGADHELQARLHNLMAKGYPSWKRVPQTKDELWAALHDLGIKSPNLDDFERWLKRTENSHIRESFDKHNSLLCGHAYPPSAEMNIGLNSTRNGDVLLAYWLDCLPAAYGDLLVKYGNSTGRQKLGFSNEPDILGLPMRTEPSPAKPSGRPKAL